MGIFEVSESHFPQGGAFPVSSAFEDSKSSRWQASEDAFYGGDQFHLGSCESLWLMKHVNFQVLQLQVMVGFTYK